MPNDLVMKTRSAARLHLKMALGSSARPALKAVRRPLVCFCSKLAPAGVW